MKKINKEYIKERERLESLASLGYAHDHSAGYYREDCGGCIAEGLYVSKPSKQTTSGIWMEIFTVLGQYYDPEMGTFYGAKATNHVVSIVSDLVRECIGEDDTVKIGELSDQDGKPLGSLYKTVPSGWRPSGYQVRAKIRK